MKKWFAVLFVLMLCGCTPVQQEEAPAPATTQEPTTLPSTEPEALQYADRKAIWLSQFDLADVYRDGNAQREQTDFTARMEEILDNVASLGFNTVFLQIRPYADSMYPSAYYPISAYAVGKAGGKAVYDPVEIIVRLAHERAISIHAWINPMRAMTREEMEGIGEEYALGRWLRDPEARGTRLVQVGSRWYLNPAYPEVAELILAGAQEAMTLYDFDGLHMDDYFYPTTDAAFDAPAYADYLCGGGELSLGDFRRETLSRLVESLCAMTRASRKGRVFGISPAGNMAAVYEEQYADVYLWCSREGYLDYICPQVYFGLEHGSFDFKKVCRAWQDMIGGDSIELLVGMTFGKAFTGEDKWAGSGKEEWKNNKDVLARCLEATLSLEDCRGIAVFCYQYLFDPVTGAPVPETEEERQNFFPILQAITWCVG